MLQLERIKSEISAVCQELGVLRLELFGSATGNRFSLGSDVDVRVGCDRMQGHLFAQYFTLEERLEELLGRSVDLVMADAIKNPCFRSSLERSRVNVHAA